MIKRHMLLGLVLAGSAAHAQSPGQVDARCEKLLPPGEVAGIAKAKDVKLVPADPAMGAGGTCNYAAGGALLMLLTVDASGGQKSFERYKGHRMYAQNQKPLPGLGDEAFSSGPKGNVVVVRKGNAVYALSSFMDPANGEFLLDGRQLTEMAKKLR